MNKKRKLLAVFALVSAGTGIGATGVGSYQSLYEHATNTEGKEAVENCVDTGKECSISEYKAAAEFSTRQDNAADMIIGGLVLSFTSSALLLSTVSSSNVQPSHKKPKKTSNRKDLNP